MILKLKVGRTTFLPYLHEVLSPPFLGEGHVPSTTSPLLFQTKIHEFSSLNIKDGSFQDFLTKKWIFEASPNRRLSKNPSTQAILPPEHCSHRFVATATVNAMEKANLWNLGRKISWGRWNLYDFLSNTYKVGQYDHYKWNYGPPCKWPYKWGCNSSYRSYNPRGLV